MFIFHTANIQSPTAILSANPPHFMKSMQMTKMLTEIGSHSLFQEYLNMIGIPGPVLARIEQRWEHRRQEKLVARILIDPQGKARYYIDARAISVN